MDHAKSDTNAPVVAFLRELEQACRTREFAGLHNVFEDDSHWRDMAAFTWNLGSVSGRQKVIDRFVQSGESINARNYRLSNRHREPRWVQRGIREVLEGFFEFDTEFGAGSGVVRLVESDTGGGLRVWMLLTRLDSLREFPFPSDRPAGIGYERRAAGDNWVDRRDQLSAFADREPEVLVVGGGHSGVMAAAHLQQLGVDTLIVDRLPRVGDNWRTRYHSLALHSKTLGVHFPYLPFPDTFPEYLPKDRLANWIEFYVDTMELNYWVSTEFLGGSFDESTSTWTVTVRRADGSERVLRPKHIILATGGIGGVPNVPALPGIDRFDGPVVHSKRFASGKGLGGKRVLVVGVGTSAHDIAYDLNGNGADVTMMQRGSVSVVSLDGANISFRHIDDALNLDEADLVMAAGFIPAVMRPNFQKLTRVTREMDAPLLAGLEKAGMKLDFGEDDTGWTMKFYTRGGGYYIDVGASALIADGTISILQADLVDTFTEAGVRLLDGTDLPFDYVVLCTGYLNQEVEVGQYFGNEVADRVGTLWGFDGDGELPNAWKPTRQQGLWFMVSGIHAARINSRHMCLIIKADLEGLIPTGASRMPTTQVVA